MASRVALTLRLNWILPPEDGFQYGDSLVFAWVLHVWVVVLPSAGLYTSPEEISGLAHGPRHPISSAAGTLKRLDAASNARVSALWLLIKPCVFCTVCSLISSSRGVRWVPQTGHLPQKSNHKSTGDFSMPRNSVSIA